MEEQNSTEREAPPPHEKVDSPESPQMSEMATLGNIFFDPSATFEDLRRKPRFIVAGIIIALLVTAYSFGLYYKIGEKGIRSYVAEQMDKRAPNLAADQKETQINMQMKISGIVRYIFPLFVFISFLIGGLLYWVGGKAFGGEGRFLHNLSVWVYASFPVAVVAMLANYLVLALKQPEEINLAESQRGLINQFTNLSFLVNGTTHPVLATLISTFDLFTIWGWILAAIGLRITNRISSGSAWALTLIIALVGVGFRVIGAVFSGVPN